MRILFFFVAALCFSSPVMADQIVSAAAVEVQSEEAHSVVSDISQKVTSIINAQGFTDAQKEEQLVSLFNDYVDTHWMGNYALGRYNRTIDVQLRKKYFELYHTYLLRSYVPRFREYGEREFNILRINQKPDGDYLVKMTLISATGQPVIQVDYRLHRSSNGRLRLVDVIGEGVSMIATQRSDFGGLISRKGLEYFVQKLEAKVKKLLKK